MAEDWWMGDDLVGWKKSGGRATKPESPPLVRRGKEPTWTIVPSAVHFILLHQKSEQLYFFGARIHLLDDVVYSFLWQNQTMEYLGSRSETNTLWEHLRKNRRAWELIAPPDYRMTPMNINWSEEDKAQIWEMMRNFWTWREKGTPNEEEFWNNFDLWVQVT